MTLPFVHHLARGTPALHYVEGPPAGPMLLLLHGVSRNWRDWDSLLPALVQRWHVIALDHRGHGESGWAAGAYRVIDYARDAAQFVAATAAKPVTILGHSLGAMVGLWLAADCGPLVSRIVLEDPPFHMMGRRIAITPYQAQFIGMRDVAQRGGDVETMTDALAEIRLPTACGAARLGDLRDRASLRFSAECLQLVDPDVFTPLAAGEWLDGFDYESFWPRVTCPTLLLQGDPAAGGAFTEADVAVARDRLARPQHIRFAGVGHQIHRTRPDDVIAALNRFADEPEI